MGQPIRRIGFEPVDFGRTVQLAVSSKAEDWGGLVGLDAGWRVWMDGEVATHGSGRLWRDREALEEAGAEVVLRAQGKMTVTVRNLQIFFEGLTTETMLDQVYRAQAIDPGLLPPAFSFPLVRKTHQLNLGAGPAVSVPVDLGLESFGGAGVALNGNGDHLLVMGFDSGPAWTLSFRFTCSRVALPQRASLKKPVILSVENEDGQGNFLEFRAFVDAEAPGAAIHVEAVLSADQTSGKGAVILPSQGSCSTCFANAYGGGGVTIPVADDSLWGEHSLTLNLVRRGRGSRNACAEIFFDAKRVESACAQDGREVPWLEFRNGRALVGKSVTVPPLGQNFAGSVRDLRLYAGVALTPGQVLQLAQQEEPAVLQPFLQEGLNVVSGLLGAEAVPSAEARDARAGNASATVDGAVPPFEAYAANFTLMYSLSADRADPRPLDGGLALRQNEDVYVFLELQDRQAFGPLVDNVTFTLSKLNGPDAQECYLRGDVRPARRLQPGGSEAEACFPYTTVRTLPPWDWVGTQGVDIEESSAVDEDGGVEDVRNATGLEKEDILTGIVTSYEASASLVPLAAPARFTVGEHRMRAQVAFISGEVRETPSTVFKVRSGSGDRFITELPQDTFQGHQLEPSDSLRAEFSADLPNATLVGCYFDNWPESRDLTAEPNLDGLGPRANGTFGPDGPQIRASLGVPFVQAHG